MRSCKSDQESEYSKAILKFGYLHFYESSENMKEFLKLMLPVFPNFETDVEKCWLDGKLIDCGDILINRPIDDGFCFTFNMGWEFRKFLQNNSGNI